MPMKRPPWSREMVETYRDGDFIVREGETSRQMYVIQRGQVAISKRVGDEDIELATLGKGDFFGEMSLLESMPRDANARAVGDTDVLTINPGGLLVRIRRDPTFALEMLQRLSGRIRTMNQHFVQTLASTAGSIDDAASPNHDEPSP